jgi:hypothetical protein
MERSEYGPKQEHSMRSRPQASAKIVKTKSSPEGEAPLKHLALRITIATHSANSAIVFAVAWLAINGHPARLMGPESRQNVGNEARKPREAVSSK